MSRLFAAPFAPAALLAALAYGPADAIEAVTGAALVMHVGPGLDHRAVGSVPADSPVTVHGCIQAERWCLVRFAGRRGWVPGETLDVVGFSRPPTPEPIAPAATPVIVVPVPIEPHARADGIVSAEDVIIGVDEHFGLAAVFGRPGGKAVIHHRPRGHGLAFKKGGSKHKFHVGRPELFSHGRFRKHDVHSAKDLRFDVALRFGHARFGKHGFRSAKDFHFDRVQFGKSRLHFRDHGKGAGHGRHFKKGHHETKFGKGGRFGGHSGKVRSFGFRIKGGWRP